jgi:hypothetical protein
MPDKVQEKVNLPAPTAPSKVPLAPKDQLVDNAEELAKQELAQTVLSKARLRELAKKNPPLPEWFDEEEEAPF